MRVILLAALWAAVAALAPVTSSAAGGTLTVPAQVQAPTGGGPVLDASFSYPDPTPFCTAGVTFTWDGAQWLSQIPIRSGGACVAQAPDAAAPAGKAGAGQHTVCGVVGASFRDC